MQLLDEEHLLLKYASEDVVTLRAAEPNTQPAFFVVYNMETAQVNKNNQFFIDCVHQIQI
jgi:de-etiolated-1